MKKKILVILGLLLILSLNIVSAGSTAVVSNSTTATGTESFSATITINETGTGNIYVYTGSIGGNLVYSENAIANASTFTYKINNDKDDDIIGGTTYYVEMNGTGENSTGAYSAINSVETTAYTLASTAVRTIIGIMTLLFVGIVVFSVIKTEFDTGNPDIKTVIMTLAGGIILALVLNNLITVILRL